MFLINQGNKSYLFDRSGNTCNCIKTFGKDVSFCQQKNTLCKSKYINPALTTNADVLTLKHLPTYYREQSQKTGARSELIFINSCHT